MGMNIMKNINNEELKQIIMDKMKSTVNLIAYRRLADASLLKFIDTRNLSFANELKISALAADIYNSKINNLDMQLAVLQWNCRRFY